MLAQTLVIAFYIEIACQTLHKWVIAISAETFNSFVSLVPISGMDIIVVARVW